MVPGLVRRVPGSLSAQALAIVAGGATAGAYPTGVIPVNPGQVRDAEEPTTQLLTGQELTPSGLLAAIAALSGAAITRPQRYDLFVAKYGTVIWVYRAVSINAQNVAAVPLKVYRNKSGIGNIPTIGEPKLIESPDSKFSMLMNKVNPIMTRYDMWELTSINLDLVGNSYWVIFRDADDEPAEIWPVRPDRVEILSDPTFGIRGYRYRVPRGVFDFSLRDVIHIKYQNPWHDWYGQGALSPAWAQTEAYETMVAWRKFFYDNNAQPAAVLQTPKQLNKQQIDLLREMWQSMFSGPRNAGRIAILQDDLKYEKAGASPRDAMIVKDLELSRQDILAAFGVPLAAAGVEQGDTGRRAEQIRNYRESTIKPRLEKIEQVLNEFLAPQFGPDFEAHFDTSEFIREDELQRSQVDVAEVNAGLVTINEARSRRGLRKVRWGDVWWMGSGLVPAVSPKEFKAEEAAKPPESSGEMLGLAGGQGDASTDPKEPKAPPPDDAAEIDTPGLENLSDEGKALLIGIGDGLAKVGLPVPRRIRGLLTGDSLDTGDPQGIFVPELIETSPEGIWKAYIERTLPIERKFASHVRGALLRIGRASVAAIRRSSSVKQAIENGTPELGTIVPVFVAIGKDLYPQILEMGWDEGNRRRAAAGKKALKAKAGAGLDFDLAIPDIERYIETRPKQYATDISKTTIRHIREQIQEGVTEGESIEEIADRLMEFADIDSNYRAQRIARTETISASNAGSMGNYRESGVIERKQWLTAGDERVRDAHYDAEGQTVDLDEPFTVDNEELDYPGDPDGSPENIINCRCTVLPVVKGGPLDTADDED